MGILPQFSVSVSMSSYWREVFDVAYIVSILRKKFNYQKF